MLTESTCKKMKIGDEITIATAFSQLLIEGAVSQAIAPLAEGAMKRLELPSGADEVENELRARYFSAIDIMKSALRACDRLPGDI